VTLRFLESEAEVPVASESELPEAESDAVEDDSPPVEEPEEETDDLGVCPREAHLHVAANRHLGMSFPWMDIGHQILTGKGPWSLYSHCPRCGKLVEDRGNPHFRCDGQDCEARWDVPREGVRAGRELARRSPEGEQVVLSTGGGS
jgi:hypothetical protein